MSRRTGPCPSRASLPGAGTSEAHPFPERMAARQSLTDEHFAIAHAGCSASRIHAQRQKGLNLGSHRLASLAALHIAPAVEARSPAAKAQMHEMHPEPR